MPSSAKQPEKARYFYLLLLVAFLLNVMLPFVAVYDTQQALASHSEQSSSNSNLSSLLGDKILICTSSGFKWVSWDDLQQDNNQTQSHSKYQCALCYLAANHFKHSVPIQHVAIFYQKNIRHVFSDALDFTAIPQPTHRLFLARAPPDIA